MKLPYTKEVRGPIFDAAKVQGATFETLADVKVLDDGIDLATAAIPDCPEIDEERLAATLRGFWGSFTQDQWDAVRAALYGTPEPAATPDGVTQLGLTDEDWRWGASRLAATVAQLRAVWQVECAGKGWFTDVRGDILAKDGPGGFLDGPNLPKLLFEAHHFDRLTGGKYRTSHPNISSRTWNRALYVGGQGEWVRLWQAMQLDRTAALKSASYGGPQIMGFNHKLAGFATVEAFVDAMKTSERAHLEAFVNFIINSGLADELRKVSNKAADCVPLAAGYNGKAHAKNNYAGKIAAEHKRFSS
jgi:hypothetical protein